MPVAFIRLPARMKNGTASRGKLCVAVTIFWTATVSGMVPVSEEDRDRRQRQGECHRNADEQEEGEQGSDQ